MSPPITRKFRKIDQKKKHTEHERDVKNRVFDPGAPVYFRIFHGIFSIFLVFFCRFSACIACILTRSVHCVYNMDIQVCIMLDKCVYRYQKGICPHVQCVVRACRTFLSCSVCQKRASSRAQCVFFTFFFLKPPTACRTPSKRETKKKPALLSIPRNF